MRIRYAITHINRDGMRTLTLANQGRHHFDTRAEALEHLAALLGPNGLCKVLNEKQVESLEVRSVKCYDHGDAIGVFFDE